MLSNVLDAVRASGSVAHVALVTGSKHYLGPFEAYAKAPGDTPFREAQPRLPYENFYYDQEDILFAAAADHEFAWSEHRAHTMIGWALGNATNMGITLAVYATIRREQGRPFVFPGSPQHTDGDLGRPIEAFAGMTKSRTLGFLGFRDTERTFLSLFDRLRSERIIP